MTQTQTINLDPSVILVEDNVRFGLKPTRLAALKADIEEFGGIHTPGEVEPLDTPSNGKTHRLTVGHYRHEAVTRLNAEAGKVAYTFPATVREAGDPVARIRRQLSENLQREDMSPMDKAVALSKLIDAGVPKVEIRKMFMRPTGKKGTLEPASNAWVNMTHSFLGLPKTMQQKIHNGDIAVSAAYELTKITDPDKRQEVLERAEEIRQRELDRENKDEERFLKAESRAQTEEQKEAELTKAIADAQTAVDASRTILTAKQSALKVAQGTLKKAKKSGSDQEVQNATEHLKAAKAELKEAEKQQRTDRKALERLKNKTAARKAAAAEAPKAQRAGGKGKGKAVTRDDVQKAAKETGASTKAVPLTIAGIRAVVDDLCKPGTSAKVRAIGQAFASCFAGETTDDQLYNTLVTIVGDKAKAPKVQPTSPITEKAKKAKGSKKAA